MRFISSSIFSRFANSSSCNATRSDVKPYSYVPHEVDKIHDIYKSKHATLSRLPISVNQLKQIYIATCVASESEERDGRD